MSAEENDKIESGFNKLVNEVKGTLNHQLKDIYSSFLESADTALFDLANEAGSNDEQKQYFELLQGIRADKENLIRGLHEAFSVYLKPAGERVADDESEIDDDDGELSLVSQDTMEEMVLINTITGKTEEKFNESMGKLELRLEYLAKHSQGLFAKDALTPKHFCTGFKEAITILDITISDKLILYKLFDNEVISKLNVIYDVLNNLLIEAEILPKVKLHQNSKSTKPASGKSSNQDEVHAPEDPENIEADNGAGTGSARVNNANNSNSPGGSTGHVNNRNEVEEGLSASSGYYATEESEAGKHGAQGFNGSSYPASGAAQQEIESGQQGLHENSGENSGKNLGGYPVEKINQVISEFIGRGNVNEGSVEGSPQFYGHNDVLTALTKMQAVTCKEIQQESPVVERINESEIKQVLLSTIASTQGGAITKQIDQVIEKTIDFIKLIFDAIIDDKSISDTIKALLLTLQIPVIKASMLDQEFFISDDHPARLLLDKIAELGVGVTSSADDVYQLINQIVQTLLAEYSNDINAFIIALESIESVIDERAKRVEEQEKKAQQEVQKIHARKIVLWELRKSTFGKELPALVHKLVLKVWPTLMFNHYVKNGKENDKWITLVTVLHELIESIQPPASNEEFKELQAIHIALTVRVERHLNKYKAVQQYRKEVMQSLRDTYKNLLDAYEPVKDDQSPEADITEATSASTASEDEIIHALDELNDETLLMESQKEPELHPDEPVSQRDKLKLLPADVRPGVWFQITMENDRIRRLKLSMVIVEDALLIFVDHEGNRIVEREAEVFAEELDNGAANIIMHHSVFDHALTSAYETIK